jgi:superfamily II DNA or RNA helicase
MKSCTQEERSALFSRLASDMNYTAIRKEQIQAITPLVFDSRDSYFNLPTNFGKTLIAIAAALITQYMNGNACTLFIVPTQVIVLVID